MRRYLAVDIVLAHQVHVLQPTSFHNANVQQSLAVLAQVPIRGQGARSVWHLIRPFRNQVYLAKAQLAVHPQTLIPQSPVSLSLLDCALRIQ